ncbi:MAG: glycosyltransferase [Candidatus Micrarchaeia archaeon]
MKLSIIIPTHDEGKRIASTLAKLSARPEAKRGDWEIIVVDDGRDSTAAKARRFPGVRVFHHPKRLGKGGAVMEGIRKARAPAVLMYDADAATPPSEIPKLLKALESADVAIGCRYCAGSRAEMPGVRRIIGKAFNLAVRLLFLLPFKDTQCGFKAAKRAKILPLLDKFIEKHLVWDVEFLWLAKKKGLRVVQVPVRWKHVAGGPVASGGAAGVARTAWRMLSALVHLRLARL